ncbi:MAG: hypothetical protein ACLRIL_07925 [Fusicatenibacter saccharivorans]
MVLESDVDTLLTPVLIGSTLLSTDSTHTMHRMKQTARLSWQNLEKRAIEGAQSAQNQKKMSSLQELKKLSDFDKGKATGKESSAFNVR